jgi:alpha-ribazole phosphatase
MKIIFIRHGQSEGNIADIINDDPARPVPLTEHGRQQARAATEQLHAMPISHAYASQFLRTQQTAEILLQGRECPLDIDARINERRSGMDGLHVDNFNNFVRPDPLHIRPPHGESFIEQMERLRGFMDEIAARHPDGVVLAVSHEHPIVAALAVANGRPEQAIRQSVKNCGWIELEIQG